MCLCESPFPGGDFFKEPGIVFSFTALFLADDFCLFHFSSCFLRSQLFSAASQGRSQRAELDPLSSQSPGSLSFPLVLLFPQPAHLIRTIVNFMKGKYFQSSLQTSLADM